MSLHIQLKKDSFYLFILMKFYSVCMRVLLTFGINFNQNNN